MSLKELDLALEDVSLRIKEMSEELIRELERREDLNHALQIQNDLVSVLAEQRKAQKTPAKGAPVKSK